MRCCGCHESIPFDATTQTSLFSLPRTQSRAADPSERLVGIDHAIGLQLLKFRFHLGDFLLGAQTQEIGREPGKD